MDWYYVKDGRQVGPVPASEIRALAASGAIGPQTLVWAAGMPEWRPFSAAQGMVAEGEQGGVVCSRCGRQVPPAEAIEYGGLRICAACKPAFVQGLKEGAALHGVTRFGGFWIRFAARFVDGIVLWLVSTLISLPIMLALFGSASPDPDHAAANLPAFLAVYGAVMLLQFSVAVAYEVLFLGRFGATPGKMACRLKVVTTENRPISYGRALGRYFGYLLSGLTLGIGYIIAAFDDQKRSLHDRICDTRVVKA